MIQAKQRQCWLIRGMDGLNVIYEERIGVGQITDKQIRELLKALTAKLALSEKEIISSYAKKGTKVYQNYLEVRYMAGRQFMYSCGDNPYVIAEVEVEHAS